MLLMKNYSLVTSLWVSRLNLKVFYATFLFYQDEYATASGRTKDRSAGRQEEASGDGFIDGKLSKQILNQAKSQMLELEQELSGGVIKKRLSAPSEKMFYLE